MEYISTPKKKKSLCFFVLKKGVLVQSGTQNFKANFTTSTFASIAFRNIKLDLAHKPGRWGEHFFYEGGISQFKQIACHPQTQLVFGEQTCVSLLLIKKKKKAIFLSSLSLFLFFPPLLESPTRHNNGENSSHIKMLFYFIFLWDIKMLLEACSKSAPNFIKKITHVNKHEIWKAWLCIHVYNIIVWKPHSFILIKESLS